MVIPLEHPKMLTPGFNQAKCQMEWNNPFLQLALIGKVEFSLIPPQKGFSPK